MTKFIIEIQDDIDEIAALGFVASVMDGGKVSETNGVKHYCHMTTFKNCVEVHCLPNAKSLRFIVRKTK